MAQKILVLDDEENYAEMLESLLEQHFFLVDSATKPEEALKALEQEGYELVISDYKMPVMDGADFLLKAREINPDLPFIIVSGLMNTPELVKVANMGVTLVLEKPIDIENFINQVKNFVTPLAEEEYADVKSSDGDSSEGNAPTVRKFIKTYPDDLEFVSDSSATMQFFVQDLWDAVQEQSHIFISIPPGSEIELILREIKRWKQFPGKKFHVVCPGPSVSSTELLRQFTLVAKDDSYANLIAVTGFSSAPLSAQEMLVDAIREAPDDLCFTYFIESTLLDQAAPAINEELLELIQESLCRMPPLKVRPSDLATYVKRILPRIARVEGHSAIAEVEPDAARALLAYDWPGNFAELISVLRSAAIVEESNALTSESVQRFLKGSNADLTDLESHLAQYQADLLKKATDDSGESTMQILEALGVDYEPTGESTEGADFPLLFPDLLTTPVAVKA
ncbi:sigma-54-dependent transcriptional regulator [Rubellicoccus peritrichatus]|uniref:Response regulator n=1 Tax=Rubellicoccus peritrichatus TaxID=3080537 RepID=A0AAQ3QXB7_9BACT|nr:response regulator [Puniceicoccus sp. CR14]WOO42872.1 response regulator [Puniceicoccus sp. CR14]